MTYTGITIKLHRGSTAHWAEANPVLAEGEIGVDTDLHQVKVGPGAWNSLDFIGGTGGGGGGLDAESVRDTIAAALVGSGLVSVTPNDPANTITVATTATANDTDANLKNRANHTGTQTSSTISDFNTAADARITAASLYKPGGTDVALADGGTGTSLADPNADRILFWDDSAGVITWLTPSTGLTITGTSITSSGGAGGGDASTNTSTSVDGEVALFSGTGGKTLKRATGSGIVKLTSGVQGIATAGTDYVAFNGALGTPTSGVATNLTGLPSTAVITSTGTVASSATPAINTSLVDMFGITALAVDITSMTTNLSGSPTDGEMLWVYIVGTGTRAITWGSKFEDGAARLPISVGTTRLDVFFVYNGATAKWRCMDTSELAPRVLSITSSATPTFNTDLYDGLSITALAAAITSMTTNLTGTGRDMQPFKIRIKDNGSARAITWGASFEDGSVALPLTTVAGKTLLVQLVYDVVDGKWACEAQGSRA